MLFPSEAEPSSKVSDLLLPNRASRVGIPFGIPLVLVLPGEADRPEHLQCAWETLRAVRPARALSSPR